MQAKPQQNKTKTLKEAARRAYVRGRYGDEDDIAVVWQFIDTIPKTLPRLGLKVVLYTAPWHQKGIIVISDNIDDLVWESEWEEGVTCYKRYVNEKKLLTRLENFDINTIEVIE